MDEPVKNFFKKLNIVVPQTEFFVLRSSEYYLHFNVKLPLPEEPTVNNCQTKKENLSKVNNFNK